MPSFADSNARKLQWEDSYRNRDNFVFYPHDEVVRFFARHIRKRIGVDEFRDIESIPGTRALDLGCGIGRHVIYCHEMGLEAYGIDLSEAAIQIATEWAARRGVPEPTRRIQQGDIRHLPWPDGYFAVTVSHGVLDSMPFEAARSACEELARKMASGGWFYCDLISGDDSRHSREFSGEEIVTTRHEHGTVQLFFNLAMVHALFDGLFEIIDCLLIRHQDVVGGGYWSRYHVALKKV